MPFIDRSYFIGDLNIPNLSETANQERIDWFIEKHEPELLRDLLGYSLYKAFTQGLQGMPVAQKWTDLLEGVEYTDSNGDLKKWTGFVAQPLDLLNALDAANTIGIIVGRGTLTDSVSGLLLDPVTGSSSVPLPSTLVGKDFIFEKRAFGRLDEDEYSIVGGNIIQLTAPLVFEDGDRYYYKAATLSLNTSTGSVKKSLIANYVYYHWQRDRVSQTVGLGEAATKAENAAVVSPEAKMIRAWNEMVDYIKELVCFLDTKRSDYPEWEKQNLYCLWRKFWYINEFGI